MEQERERGREEGGGRDEFPNAVKERVRFIQRRDRLIVKSVIILCVLK